MDYFLKIVLLEPRPNLFILILSTAAVVLWRQSWVAAAETTQPAKTKIFTNWSFAEKVATLLI